MNDDLHFFSRDNINITWVWKWSSIPKSGLTFEVHFTLNFGRFWNHFEHVLTQFWFIFLDPFWPIFKWKWAAFQSQEPHFWIRTLLCHFGAKGWPLRWPFSQPQLEMRSLTWSLSGAATVMNNSKPLWTTKHQDMQIIIFMGIYCAKMSKQVKSWERILRKWP